MNTVLIIYYILNAGTVMSNPPPVTFFDEKACVIAAHTAMAGIDKWNASGANTISAWFQCAPIQSGKPS
jgi:hypothetical protein